MRRECRNRTRHDHLPADPPCHSATVPHQHHIILDVSHVSHLVSRQLVIMQDMPGLIDGRGCCLRVSAASSCVRTHHSRKVWTFACKHERQSQRKTDKAHTQERKSTVRTGTRGTIMYIRRRQHPLRRENERCLPSESTGIGWDCG
jgi:hypothetical protein